MYVPACVCTCLYTQASHTHRCVWCCLHVHLFCMCMCVPVCICFPLCVCACVYAGVCAGVFVCKNDSLQLEFLKIYINCKCLSCKRKSWVKVYFPWKSVDIFRISFWLLLWRNLGVIWFFSLYMTLLVVSVCMVLKYILCFVTSSIYISMLIIQYFLQQMA